MSQYKAMEKALDLALPLENPIVRPYRQPEPIAKFVCEYCGVELFEGQDVIDYDDDGTYYCDEICFANAMGAIRHKLESDD